VRPTLVERTHTEKLIQKRTYVHACAASSMLCLPLAITFTIIIKNLEWLTFVEFDLLSVKLFVSDKIDKSGWQAKEC
jgi:hypothetical protein